MSNLETKKAADLVAAQDLAEWGGPQEMTSQDIIIAKILPLQHMSDKVANKEGMYGEFRDTLANRKFGDLDTPFTVIPFYMEKKWYEFDIVTNKSGKSGARKREFARVVPITAANDGLPYADTDGKTERDRCMDFYCLIPSEVEAGTAMPYVLSFRRTSLKAGKQIATQFMANARAGKVPAAVAMKISGKDTQNDDGSFVVMSAQPDRLASAEEIMEAKKWYDLIRKGQTKLDDSDVVSEPVATERTVNENRF